MQAASASRLFDFLISAVHSGQEPRIKSLTPIVKALATTTTGGLSYFQIIPGCTELPSKRERYAIAGAPVCLPKCRHAQHECMANLSALAQHLFQLCAIHVLPRRLVFGMQGPDRRVFQICVSVLPSKIGAVRGCRAYISVCGHEFDTETSWNRMGLCVPRQLAQARPTLNKRTCNVRFAPLKSRRWLLTAGKRTWASEKAIGLLHCSMCSKHLRCARAAA